MPPRHAELLPDQKALHSEQKIKGAMTKKKTRRATHPRSPSPHAPVQQYILSSYHRRERGYSTFASPRRTHAEPAGAARLGRTADAEGGRQRGRCVRASRARGRTSRRRWIARRRGADRDPIRWLVAVRSLMAVGTSPGILWGLRRRSRIRPCMFS